MMALRLRSTVSQKKVGSTGQTQAGDAQEKKKAQNLLPDKVPESAVTVTKTRSIFTHSPDSEGTIVVRSCDARNLG
jgi:phosphatidate phosphatase APP1